MPLHPGKSRAVFSQNVSEMMHAGHPQDQALAAAYREQRQSRPMGGPVFPAPGLNSAPGGPQMGLGSLAQRGLPAGVPGLSLGMPSGLGGLGNLRRPGFQGGGAPSDDDYYGGLARDLPGELSTPRKEWGPGDFAAMGASAADPFGIPSAITGRVSPAAGAAWRGLEEEHPEASEAGAVMTPMGAVGAAGKAGLKGVAEAARAFPKTATGIGTAGALAAGTAEAGDQPKGRPEFTDEDKQRLAHLDEQSEKVLPAGKSKALDALAAKKAPLSQKKAEAQTWDDQIAAARKEATDMRSRMQERQADYDTKGQPLAIRDPELVDEIRKGAIGYAASHGAVRGLLGGSPWRAAGTAAMGAGEALTGAFAPTMLDLFQPPDTQAYKQAHDNLQSPEFWKTVIAPDVLFGGTAAATGHGTGATVHEVGRRISAGIASAARGIGRLFGGAGEAAEGPGGAAAETAAAAPKPWPTNPDGTRKWPDSHTELQGLKQSDKDGRWRDRFGHVVPANLEPPGQASGGGIGVAGYQMGGAPWYERAEARALGHTGPVIGSSLGRGDAKSMTVPGGSYVLPSKFVSGLGQGNTNAGHGILNAMFSGGPYGTSIAKPGGRSNIPRPPKMGGFAAGGAPGQGVPIKISDGEHVLSPEQVKEVDRYFGGPGDIEHGHKTLDAWVMHEHGKLIKELKKLPPPAESDLKKAT